MDDNEGVIKVITVGPVTCSWASAAHHFVLEICTPLGRLMFGAFSSDVGVVNVEVELPLDKSK